MFSTLYIKQNIENLNPMHSTSPSFFEDNKLNEQILSHIFSLFSLGTDIVKIGKAGEAV